MSKNKKTYPLAMAVAAALLAAVSIVCGKYLAIRGGDVLRFSFENLPILLAGIAFGPAVAALTGIAADIIGCLLVGYTLNPIITLGAALIGFLSGIGYRYLKNVSRGAGIIAAVSISHLIGSVLVKTVGLAVFYSMPFMELLLWRLLNYAIIGVLEGVLLYAIVKSQAVQNELERICGRRV